MQHRPLKTLAVCTFVASCGIVCGHALRAQAPANGSLLTAPAPSIDRSIPLHEPAHHQMQALGQHARERMILYPGRFGQSDLAKRELEMIALKLKASGKF